MRGKVGLKNIPSILVIAPAVIDGLVQRDDALLVGQGRAQRDEGRRLHADDPLDGRVVAEHVRDPRLLVGGRVDEALGRDLAVAVLRAYQ